MQGQPSNQQSRSTDKDSAKRSIVLAGQSPRRTAAPKRLPPLPPAAWGSTLAHKPASSGHATQQASKTPRQQQQRKAKMPTDLLQELHCSTDTDRKASENALISGTKQPEQQASQLRQLPPGKGSKTQQLVAASRSRKGQADRAVPPAAPAQPWRQDRTFKDQLAFSTAASLDTEAEPMTLASSVAEGGTEVAAVVAAATATAEETQQAGVSDSAGQQMARLTASNTALLAELVDLQVCSQFAFV